MYKKKSKKNSIKKKIRNKLYILGKINWQNEAKVIWFWGTYGLATLVQSEFSQVVVVKRQKAKITTLEPKEMLWNTITVWCVITGLKAAIWTLSLIYNDHKHHLQHLTHS